MPIHLVAPGTKPAIFVFAMVTLAYFASWLTPILFPAPPHWATSLVDFAAPAYALF